jgi:hypothetical protein
MSRIAREGLRSGIFLTVAGGLPTWFSYVAPLEGDDEDVPVVLRVSADAAGRLTLDRAGTKDAEGEKAYVTNKIIRPDALDIWTGSHWVPIARHAEVDRADYWESLDGDDPLNSNLLPDP